MSDSPGVWRRFALCAIIALLFGLSFVLDLEARVTRPVHPAVSAAQSEQNAHQTFVAWTSTRSLTAEENARRHFEKHGMALGVKTQMEYVAAARDFVAHPPPGSQTKKQKDGDLVLFHADSARFAVVRGDGAIRTYFKMDPAIHGFPSNQAYFDAQ